MLFNYNPQPKLRPNFFFFIFPKLTPDFYHTLKKFILFSHSYGTNSIFGFLFFRHYVFWQIKKNPPQHFFNTTPFSFFGETNRFFSPPPKPVLFAKYFLGHPPNFFFFSQFFPHFGKTSFPPTFPSFPKKNFFFPPTLQNCPEEIFTNFSFLKKFPLSGLVASLLKKKNLGEFFEIF